MEVTNEIKEVVLNYLEMDIEMEFSDSFNLFYYRCMKEGMNFYEADRYAILNTLFNYDIGMENALAISDWVWEYDSDVFELQANERSKNILKKATEELGIELDFSNFATEDYKEYKFFD